MTRQLGSPFAERFDILAKLADFGLVVEPPAGGIVQIALANSGQNVVDFGERFALVGVVVADVQIGAMPIGFELVAILIECLAEQVELGSAFFTQNPVGIPDVLFGTVARPSRSAGDLVEVAAGDLRPG